MHFLAQIQQMFKTGSNCYLRRILGFGGYDQSVAEDHSCVTHEIEVPALCMGLKRKPHLWTFTKADETVMATTTQPPRIVRWIAESDDTVVGSVDRTSRGKYRATNIKGRTVGTYRTITEARTQLAHKHDSTFAERLNQSRILHIFGLVALVATALIAAVGVVFLMVR